MLKQVLSITMLGLRSIPERLGPSLVIVVGLAGVVAVFTALLAMAAGFQSTLEAAGRADVALVLRGGSQAELNSGISREQGTIIKQAPGVAQGADGLPLASAEVIVIAELMKAGETTGSNITVRGVETAAFALRPKLRIVEGRAFTQGLRELIVGQGVARQFEGVRLGETLRMRGSDWTVVGVFASGDAYESELWADVDVAQSTFNRQGYSAVRLQLAGPGDLQTVQDALSADPRVNVDVETEQEYFSGQTEQFRKTIGALAGVVTFIMALGAMFAALNTMYAAVGARAREIATLRAIGFRGLPVVVSVMLESLILALAGGLLGAVAAYVLFNNMVVSTLGANFTQVVFRFAVTPALVVDGLVIAVVIGMVGGLLPALRAARQPVTTALRAA
ncbi:MAG TPA: ABC transporter permease [Steroidobacteraceae bacterium]|nr:ABC transporter permease [Steroidobacteraceae bacterium]